MVSKTHYHHDTARTLFRAFIVASALILLSTVVSAFGSTAQKGRRWITSPISSQLRSSVRGLPNEDESWFVKTERFCKPYPVVKPYLEEHREWVKNLRDEGRCITSGYRVDAEGKPGGGGLMIFAAKNHEEAERLVLQDPLISNKCVEWTLNGWVSEVGDLQMR